MCGDGRHLSKVVGERHDIGALGRHVRVALQCLLLRLQADTPCGLANLGATCYANGALQCLFTNLAFRQGLFNVEPPVADNPILGSLRSASQA